MLNATRFVNRARRAGIKIPLIAYQEAERAGLEFAVLCAVLEQETGGGRNVFGHDPTIFVGAGQVTKAKYLAYKAARKTTGKMQGVGPMQLTWWAFQDAADKLGGCWNPRFNVRVGAQILARRIDTIGLTRALWQYNGSRSYAQQVERRVLKWRRILRDPVPYRELALSAALEEVGVREVGGNNRGPRVSWYQKFDTYRPSPDTGYPWCAAFVNAMFAKAGRPLRELGRSAGVEYIFGRARALGWVVRKPKRGDLVIFTFSHIGHVVRERGDYIVTVEGNTGPVGAVSDSRNGGDGVYKKRRHKSLVRAYVRVPGNRI